MSALLATLPLQVVCQLLVPGHPGITENGTLVRGKIPRRTSSVDLPEGYVPFFEDQAAYKIHEEPATWNEARERCMSEGAYLAIADSREKITNIKSISNQSDSWLHVGIYNLANSDQWIRLDNGLPVESVPWAYDDYDHTGSCVGISLLSDGLVDYFCSGKREYFVCEIPITANYCKDESSVQATEIGKISASVENQVPATSSPSDTVPEGYVKIPRDQAAYKIYRDLVTWKEARQRCFSDGARLAIPDSAEKIWDIIRLGDNDETYLHVGIYKLNGTGQWVRIDNDLPATFLPWAVDAAPWGSEDCAALVPIVGKLVDMPCDSLRWDVHYVCEIPIPVNNGEGESTDQVPVATEETNTTTLPEIIPEGYVAFPEDHAAYKIHTESATWHEARDKCILEGARLAVIDSVDKIENIKSLKHNWDYQWLHVGIRKLEKTDQWIRIDTDLPLASVLWGRSEPSGSGDCVAISLIKTRLTDINCDWGEPFVCEIPIGDLNLPRNLQH